MNLIPRVYCVHRCQDWTVQFRLSAVCIYALKIRVLYDEDQTRLSKPDNAIF